MTRLSVQCLVYWQQLLRIPSTITLLLQCTEYSIHPTLFQRIWTSCEIRTMKDVIYSGNIQQRLLFININCVILGSAGSQRPEFACPKIGLPRIIEYSPVFTGIYRVRLFSCHVLHAISSFYVQVCTVFTIQEWTKDTSIFSHDNALSEIRISGNGMTIFLAWSQVTETGTVDFGRTPK